MFYFQFYGFSSAKILKTFDRRFGKHSLLRQEDD